LSERGAASGAQAGREPVPALGVRARAQRNAAILAVVLGLVALGGATLGFLMWEAKRSGRGDYTGASQLEPGPAEVPTTLPARPDPESR